MSRGEPPLEEILEEIVAQLARDFKRIIYPHKHFERLRRLETPSEKAIYLLLMIAQPQTFTSTRRILNLSRDTVDRALRRLRKLRYIMVDERFLYWIVE